MLFVCNKLVVDVITTMKELKKKFWNWKEALKRKRLKVMCSGLEREFFKVRLIYVEFVEGE